jgi:hypothetical protein
MSIAAERTLRASEPGLAPNSRWDRVFYTGMSLAFLATVVTGFGRPYFFRTVTGAPILRPLVFVHATVMTAWMVLLLVQTGLVASGRRALHRKLGWLGATLAAGAVILGYITAIAAARHGYDPSARVPKDALAFLATPLMDIVVFGPMVLWAIFRRTDLEGHKRLMLLAVIGGLLSAPLPRLPLGAPWFPIVLLVLFFLAGPVYDRWSRGSVHWVYKWLSVPLFLTYPSRIAIGLTAPSHDLARVLTR